MSSYNLDSYLWVKDLSKEGILQLFSRAKQIKSDLKTGIQSTLAGRQICFVFSEASTRTKMSFQMAAQRLGAQCLVIDDVKSSSMSKGESFSDTFWTLHSMKPDLFVIRCGDEEPLDEIVAKSEVPVISAGFGSKSHPTQALLDAFTLMEQFGSLEGLKVLFVGDVSHSRVASSSIEIFKTLGAEVKICAPKEFYEQEQAGAAENFSQLSEAISWCDVYVGLRVQFERHGKIGQQAEIKKNFQENFSLNEAGLKTLGAESVIMHPGPVNWGVEFSTVVQTDPRLLIWKQKENGVYTRAALMEKILKVSL